MGKKKQYITYIVRKRTSNGIAWGKRESVINCQEDDSPNRMIVSPSVLWNPKKRAYCMWYVDDVFASRNRNIIYVESLDGRSWAARTRISMDRYIDPWHIDVNFFDGRYHLINYTLEKRKGINYFISTDGIRFDFVKELLAPSIYRFNSFYRDSLYRSCSVKGHDGVRLYISASDGIETSIGLMSGNTLSDLTLVGVQQ